MKKNGEVLKAVSLLESIERMQENGIKRLVVSYKDRAIGRGVLTYEGGQFTRLLTIANNPTLTDTSILKYEVGIELLKKMFDETYSVVYTNIVYDEDHVKAVRKEVV